MKIWHISDTHSFHGLLEVPEDIDMVIHSGDFSNYKDFYKNEPEARDFLVWYASLKIKHKILIAGNHDAYPATHGIQFRLLCKEYNIIYLENEYVTIDGIKIFGSPHTPTFGDWYFMKQRSKLNEVWDKCDEDIDIFVVHGPPKGILDKSYSRSGELEMCGCRALFNHMIRIKPKLCLFGHIHNTDDLLNQGTYKMGGFPTTYSNGSVVTDGKFGRLSSNGNILVTY
jgi:Icc-related predicted phosphoesterase